MLESSSSEGDLNQFAHTRHFDHEYDISLSCPRRIFQIAPAAIELFPKFAHVPQKELEENEQFKHHALQVVEAVDLATSMLRVVDELRDVLISLGSIHVSMGLQDVHFDVSTRESLSTLQ